MVALRSGVFDPTQRSALAELVDPGKFTEPLAVAGVARQELQHMLEVMLCIRFCEEAVGTLVGTGEARCPCHLGIGEEAVAVGVSACLRAGDRVFGAHRSHAHYLALGGDLDALLAEVLGREIGCSKGMGGSMHLHSRAAGFYGSVPIVAATIPIAAGAAIALKMDGGDGIAVSYFGDGACEEGVLHETLNLAAVRKLPMLFVAENNLYSSHLDIALRQPCDMLSRFAVAHRICALVVDGNDVLAVRAAALDLIHTARGSGPAFLEAVTYRWRGHVGPDENVDVGLRRKADDLAAWKKRDPIRRLADALIAGGMLTADALNSLKELIRKRVEDGVDRARAAPYPAPEALLQRVYIERSGAQQ